MIRPYKPEDAPAVIRLWNEAAVPEGFVPMDEALFTATFTQSPYFTPAHTFVNVEAQSLTGFVCGCTGDDLPAGNERGYYTCLLAQDTSDTALLNSLMDRLEESFAAAGKTVSDVLFFNPIRLPWLIPGTPGHQHNNAPGMPVESPLYDIFLQRGYVDRAHECAMYLNLADFAMPESMAQKLAAMAEKGWTVEAYDPQRHTGLAEMLRDLGSEPWETEILAATGEGKLCLVAVDNGVVAGFAGPVYPEPSGRGYFAGIGVAPQFEGRGFGTALFFVLCEAEKQQGAQYMSLFTGATNPAKRIYERAGFADAKEFAMLRKAL